LRVLRRLKLKLQARGVTDNTHCSCQGMEIRGVSTAKVTFKVTSNKATYDFLIVNVAVMQLGLGLGNSNPATV